MKIATWNVNSLKVRLPQLLDWLMAQTPDVVCLQETKLEDAAFPRAALAEAGFHAVFAGQKTYNGVAILTRRPPAGVTIGLPGLDDAQKRLIAATVADVRVICAYFPNGQAVGSDKFAYKLSWLGALIAHLGGELATHPRLVLAGDFNIAPEDRDVYDPVAWAGQVLCSESERDAFRRLQALGLADAFRLFDQPGKSYSWWDYRQMAFRRNMGLRIDHLLVSTPLAPRVTACTIDKEARRAERPSDHAPVLLELADD